MKPYNTIVFIGRFQILHNAHIKIIEQASAMAEQVVVIIGSANQPRTFKNPFRETERKAVLIESLNCSNVIFKYNIDTIYNDQAWAIRIQELVNETMPTGKVGIIGHDKDASTYYLNMFPQWERIDVGTIVEPLNATKIRDLYFRSDFNKDFISNVVPVAVLNFLMTFKETEAYKQIIREREFIAMYKKQYESLVYPPIFVTTDAIVVQSGHVLMIKRKAEPGKGLWALPGGFLNADTDKSVLDGMLRELKEETKIKVPVPVLKGNIKNQLVFDHPDRSARGRTITHAFYIVLPDGELPKVKGSDDAMVAEWIPIGILDSALVFEDHYEIVNYFIGG
jgi:bifunctional NMN adenylyltransferase/nudix hydrolase